MMQLASDYIRNKVLTAGWTGGISWAWLSHACEANKRWIPSITRFTLLRWAVNEDDDEWLARRGQSRQKNVLSVQTLAVHTHSAAIKPQFVKHV